MPLYAKLAINEKNLYAFYISRVEHMSVDDDSVNIYSIVVREDVLDATGEEWSPSWGDYLNGDHFTHRYGDGAAKCLEHGLKAWYENGKKLA